MSYGLKFLLTTVVVIVLFAFMFVSSVIHKKLESNFSENKFISFLFSVLNVTYAIVVGAILFGLGTLLEYISNKL